MEQESDSGSAGFGGDSVPFLWRRLYLKCLPVKLAKEILPDDG